VTTEVNRLTGQVLDGQYRVEAYVGEGHFSVVYNGRHLGLDEPIAIKCLKLDHRVDAALVTSFVAHFRDESRIQYRLSQGSLNICRSIASGTFAAPATGETVPYTVLEWLDGVNLAQDLRVRREAGHRGRSLEDVLRLLGTAAEGVGYAHAQGVVHRDLQPSNLFLARTRDGLRTKVLDFGVAKVVSDHAMELGARSDMAARLRLFHPLYGAPEQWNERIGPIGPWTDVYAFALIAVEMLCDRPAMGTGTETDLAGRATTASWRPTPRALGVDVGPRVEDVFVRALQVAPDARFGSLAEMWTALERAALHVAPRRLAGTVPGTHGPLPDTTLTPADGPVQSAVSPFAQTQPSHPTDPSLQGRSPSAPPPARPGVGTLRIQDASQSLAELLRARGGGATVDAIHALEEPTVRPRELASEEPPNTLAGPFVAPTGGPSGTLLMAQMPDLVRNALDPVPTAASTTPQALLPDATATDPDAHVRPTTPAYNDEIRQTLQGVGSSPEFSPSVHTRATAPALATAAVASGAHAPEGLPTDPASVRGGFPSSAQSAQSPGSVDDVHIPMGRAKRSTALATWIGIGCVGAAAALLYAVLGRSTTSANSSAPREAPSATNTREAPPPPPVDLEPAAIATAAAAEAPSTARPSDTPPVRTTDPTPLVLSSAGPSVAPSTTGRPFTNAAPSIPPTAPTATPPAESSPKTFDRAAAKSALDLVNGILVSCRKKDGVTGPGQATVAFSRDGTVASVVITKPPYGSTAEATCVAGRLKLARVAPFEGPPGIVDYTFSIPAPK
jgi:serine/threonine protein kinase